MYCNQFLSHLLHYDVIRRIYLSSKCLFYVHMFILFYYFFRHYLPNLTLKYWGKILFNSMGGGKIGHVSVLISLLANSYFFFFLNYKLMLDVFAISKAISNREICFTKAVLLLREHGYFSLSFASTLPILSGLMSCLSRLSSKCLYPYKNMLHGQDFLDIR